MPFVVYRLLCWERSVVQAYGSPGEPVRCVSQQVFADRLCRGKQDLSIPPGFRGIPISKPSGMVENGIGEEVEKAFPCPAERKRAEQFA